MANKYHRQGFKIGKLVQSGKFLKNKTTELVENVYKADKKNDQKQKIIDSLNRKLDKDKFKKTYFLLEPTSLDYYTDVMASDFNKKTGPHFDRLRKKQKEAEKRNKLKKGKK